MSNENPIQAFIAAIPQTLDAAENSIEVEQTAPESSIEIEEEVKTEDPPKEATPPEEPKSKAARRLLEREKQLREQKAEFETKLKDYDKAKSEVLNDPNSYLESLGLSQEDKLLVARVIFFEENPDLATPEVEQLLAEQKRKRWERKIEEKVNEKADEKEEQTKDPEEEQLPLNEYGIPVAHETYFKSLADYAVAADVETFPLTAHYMSHGDAEKDEVVYSMYNLAVNHAKEQKGKGEALTPEKLFERIEAELVKRRDKLIKSTPEPQVTPEQPPKVDAAPKSLRSNSIVAAPPETPDYSLSPEAKAKRMARAMQILEGK